MTGFDFLQIFGKNREGIETPRRCYIHKPFFAVKFYFYFMPPSLERIFPKILGENGDFEYDLVLKYAYFLLYSHQDLGFYGVQFCLTTLSQVRDLVLR